MKLAEAEMPMGDSESQTERWHRPLTGAYILITAV